MDFNFQKTLAEKGYSYELLLSNINEKHRNTQESGRWVHRSNHRKLKLELLEAFRECFWCGIPVRDFIVPEREQSPDDMATLDHSKSRWYRAHGEWVPKVLACYKCNTDRNSMEVREMRAIGRFNND